MGRQRRERLLPALRLHDRLFLPPPERSAALALQSVPERLLGDERHPIPRPQAAPQGYLLAIAIFCNEVKGKSMLAMSRDLGVQYKTSYVLAHKMREAMASEMKGVNVGGAGRKAEI